MAAGGDEIGRVRRLVEALQVLRGAHAVEVRGAWATEDEARAVVIDFVQVFELDVVITELADGFRVEARGGAHRTISLAISASGQRAPAGEAVRPLASRSGRQSRFPPRFEAADHVARARIAELNEHRRGQCRRVAVVAEDDQPALETADVWVLPRTAGFEAPLEHGARY